MINMIRKIILYNDDKHEKKDNCIKRKRRSVMLTSAPSSTKNLTISIEFTSIAILRGESLIKKEFY